MGVNLSRSAWHYRLQKYTFGKEPNTFNLCPYFWATVWALICLPTTMLGSAAAPYMDTTSESGSGYYYDNTRYKSNIDIGFYTGFMTFLSLLGVTAAIALVYMLLVVVMTPGGALTLLVVGVSLAVIAGLVFSAPLWFNYLVAVKDSVCPIITWRE